MTKYIDQAPTATLIKESLAEMATAVVLEMRDAPDQMVAPLSRDDVARIHASYEIHHEADDTYHAEREAVGRTSEYQPDLAADYVFSFSAPDHEENPGSCTPSDWVSAAEEVLSAAVTSGNDVELELGDGNSIYIDSHEAARLIHSKKIGQMDKFVDSLELFTDFMKELYGKDAGQILEPDSTYSEDEDEDEDESLEEAYNKNKRVTGRTAVVNRIRGGKVQFRKVTSQARGFKIKGGQLVRMQPQEIRRRKRAAKISARKRKQEQGRINRARKISLKLRKTRLGA